jgi:curved DNA-binding protein CbpA
MKTLYSILGVDPAVSTDDLENAYLRRKVAYPQSKLDSDENARIQWQGIDQAYKTLSNPDARVMYDRRLANAEVKTVTAVSQQYDEDRSGWLSTRNVVIAGMVLIVISGMWFYHARETARLQKEIVERALRIAEEEKKKQAEMQEAAEERRQAQFRNQQQREQENRDRAFQREAQQSVRESQYQSAQSANMARQEQSQRDQRERNEQAAKRQAQYEAERRLANEKNQVRTLCMQRYGRPDC